MKSLFEAESLMVQSNITELPKIVSIRVPSGVMIHRYLEPLQPLGHHPRGDRYLTKCKGCVPTKHLDQTENR